MRMFLAVLVVSVILSTSTAYAAVVTRTLSVNASAFTSEFNAALVPPSAVVSLLATITFDPNQNSNIGTTITVNSITPSYLGNTPAQFGYSVTQSNGELDRLRQARRFRRSDSDR